jgi:hypothetical protein
MYHNELLLDPRHLGVSSVVPKKISMPYYLALRLALSPNELNELPLDPRHLGVPSDVPKTIFEPIACSAPVVQLSCIEINTVGYLKLGVPIIND